MWRRLNKAIPLLHVRLLETRQSCLLAMTHAVITKMGTRARATHCLYDSLSRRNESLICRYVLVIKRRSDVTVRSRSLANQGQSLVKTHSNTRQSRTDTSPDDARVNESTQDKSHHNNSKEVQSQRVNKLTRISRVNDLVWTCTDCA